jgi:hypothetical protein
VGLVSPLVDCAFKRSTMRYQPRHHDLPASKSCFKHKPSTCREKNYEEENDSAEISSLSCLIKTNTSDGRVVADYDNTAKYSSSSSKTTTTGVPNCGDAGVGMENRKAVSFRGKATVKSTLTRSQFTKDELGQTWYSNADIVAMREKFILRATDDRSTTSSVSTVSSSTTSSTRRSARGGHKYVTPNDHARKMGLVPKALRGETAVRAGKPWRWL